MSALLIVGLVIAGVIAYARASNEGVGSQGDATHSIRYAVGGASNTADVTYENENADTSQEGDVAVPWSYSFTAAEGAFLYISAQRGGAPGDITCSIYVDGEQVETNTSSGPYTICTASGRL